MALPTAVNGQITDAVTQSNVAVLGQAPAMAMSSVYQSMAHSTGILFQNTVGQQQQAAICAQAAANQGVIQLYSMNSMAAAAAAAKVSQSDTSSNTLLLLLALKALQG
ncbi:RebB family R body protein [Rhodovibrionaceae bacterium A322]